MLTHIYVGGWRCCCRFNIDLSLVSRIRPASEPYSAGIDPLDRPAVERNFDGKLLRTSDQDKLSIVECCKQPAGQRPWTCRKVGNKSPVNDASSHAQPNSQERCRSSKMTFTIDQWPVRRDSTKTRQKP